MGAVVASAVELLKCSSLYLNFVVYDSPTSAIMTEITDEQLEELKEAFVLYDKVGDDKIDSVDVIKLLQSLTLNPLTADVKKCWRIRNSTRRASTSPPSSLSTSNSRNDQP